MDNVGSTGSVTSVGPSTMTRFEGQRLQMLDKNWCPHQIDYLAKIHSQETFSYFAQLHRLHNKNHNSCFDQPSCIAYNADMEKYTTKHVKEHCTCSMIQMPYD